MLAAVVGYASTFTIVLQGFESVGASPEQAASGLMVTSVLMGFLGIVLSLIWRQPLSIVWSTPASALLISTGAQAGGYSAAIGGVIAAAALIVASGQIRPLGRLVAAIPASLANAMLAGILFEICLAPVHAVAAQPAIVLPIVIAWALGLRFARRFAVPIAMAGDCGDHNLRHAPAPGGAGAHLARSHPHGAEFGIGTPPPASRSPSSS